jgi:hypothetical protein
VREWGLNELNERLRTELGPAVQSGPFAGMVLTRSSFREHVGPYLLGTYERELHPWIDALCSERFDRIVDIGAKFGYYAVGFARRFPRARVEAYDTDWWARRAVREMAGANDVGDRVEVYGFCRPAHLDAVAARGRTLVISDCEGFEAELFGRDGAVSSLRRATLIIEIHEAVAPGIARSIRELFSSTHEIAAVSSVDDHPSPVALDFLPPDDRARAVREIRLDQEWLFLVPHTSCVAPDGGRVLAPS